MADVLTKEQRSYNMSRIRGSNTTPEIRVRKMLWASGLRYRLKSRLPGKPDIVFPTAKLAVFVDGCFWHGCPLHMKWPDRRAKFWRDKIGGNIKRDKQVTAQLEAMGWSVLRLWEHEVKSSNNVTVHRIKRLLLSIKRPDS